MATDQLRFKLDVDRLDPFFLAYEQERRIIGLGTSLVHVTPQQRLDAIEIILGLNATSGWRREGAEPAETVFTRYLRPLLAETRDSGLALAAAVTKAMPGAFTLDLPSAKQASPGPLADARDEIEDRTPPSIRRLRLQDRLDGIVGWLHERWKAVAGVLAAIALVALLFGARAYLPMPGWMCLATASCSKAIPRVDAQQIGQSGIVPTRTRTPSPDQIASDPDRRAYHDAMALILRAGAQHPGNLSPRILAAVIAGESQTLSDPTLVLTALLTARPFLPDAVLAPAPQGARVLRAYAAALAALERGLPRSRFDDFADDASFFRPDDAIAQALLTNANSSGDDPPEARPAPPKWPDWSRWFAFLPSMLIALGLLLGLKQSVRAALRAAIKGQRGDPVEVDFGALQTTAPAPRRELARALLQREPYPSRRLHGVRSIKATLAQGGFLIPIMRPASRAVEYVFLLARRGPNDQEHLRALRLVDALRRGGSLVTTYDYDPDPRFLSPSSASAKTEKRALLDLRALRELHPHARIALVSDGRELIDYFTREPLPFVRKELGLWPMCMLLTPKPVGEWGEVEYNLAQALKGLIARATEQGFADLSAGLTTRALRQVHAIALDGAKAAFPGDGKPGRVAAWLSLAKRLIKRDPTPARPRLIRPDQLQLMSDAPPADARRAEIVANLQRWLGPDGFFWLAACALYPQLRFSITLYFGLALARTAGSPPLFDERLLSRLTLLPWFESGRMPPWLRRDLFAALAPEEQSAVRAGLDRLLAGTPPHAAGPPRKGDPVRLTIWRPDERGLDAPVDAVMADLMLSGKEGDLEPILKGKAFESVFKDARRALYLKTAGSLLTVLAWGAIAYWLWPDPAAAPDGPGAWLPLLGFVLLTGLVFTLPSLWSALPAAKRNGSSGGVAARTTGPAMEKEAAVA